MYYLKAFFFNFLVVFFANYILPGINLEGQSKLPHLEGDLIFPIALGFLNSLIFPVLRVLNHQPSILRIAVVALILNFASYAVLKFLPIAIHIASVEGYLLASLAVSIGAFLVNFFEMKHFSQNSKENPPPHT